MNTRKLSLHIGLLAALVILLASCGTPKEIAYFDDFQTVTQVENRARQQIKVRPDDKLQITVSSKDPQLAALFNLPSITSRLGQGGAVYNGTNSNYNNGIANEGINCYTVDPQGNIDFPVLGELHVEGMTRSELAGFVKGELMGRNLIKDPTVVVEFINTGVSVLGEVKMPGRYLMNRDEVTLLDALSMAGDLTIQGQRTNVRVLRNEGDTTKVYVVDLTKGNELLQNPAFYLQQDDVVYVEPNDYRKRETTVNGNTALSAGFWMSVVSVLTSVAVLIVNVAR
ncbi:MAG: polysaccharide biosynthesis/export family protein [Muribaculaceae bacterium]|nr:polysaccharide biosynthesis/export family protein [Muribaculaceae bacterium]MDE7082038.1 polysaccharide biosynthesis/export family protein [Muribaculaceae bacterium]